MDVATVGASPVSPRLHTYDNQKLIFKATTEQNNNGAKYSKIKVIPV